MKQFEIRASSHFTCWYIVASGDERPVEPVPYEEALAAREEFDCEIAVLVAEGWTPI